MQLARYTQNWVQATHQLRAGRMEHAHHSHIVFCRVCGASRGVGTSLFSLHPPAVLSSPLIAHLCTLCAPLPRICAGDSGHHHTADVRASVTGSCTPGRRSCTVYWHADAGAQLTASQPLSCSLDN